MKQDRTARASRRAVVAGGLAAWAGAGLAGSAKGQEQLPSAGGPLVTRPMAGREGGVPAIGLGTFLTFDLLPGAPREHLRQVFRTYWEAGARLVDTSPLYGTAEVHVGDFAAALGATDELVVTDKIWSTGAHLGDEGQARASLDLSLERLWRRRIDLMQCHSLVNVEMVVPILQVWKKEGRIGAVGVTHHDPLYFPALASWIERGAVDAVQVAYSIANRAAEERVLRAAAERGTAVLVAMPLEKARLHALVEGRPLPDFAERIGIGSWAQFFLAWVIAHPAVTAALPATSNPAHAAENVQALRGPLPDPDMRERMRRHMEGIPGFEAVLTQPWYPGKRYPGVIARSQAAWRERAA